MKAQRIKVNKFNLNYINRYINLKRAFLNFKQN